MYDNDTGNYLIDDQNDISQSISNIQTIKASSNDLPTFKSFKSTNHSNTRDSDNNMSKILPKVSPSMNPLPQIEEKDEHNREINDYKKDNTYRNIILFRNDDKFKTKEMNDRYSSTDKKNKSSDRHNTNISVSLPSITKHNAFNLKYTLKAQNDLYNSLNNIILDRNIHRRSKNSVHLDSLNHSNDNNNKHYNLTEKNEQLMNALLKSKSKKRKKIKLKSIEKRKTKE